MSTNTHIGRPKRYESAAEKQKAYRQRKKEALDPINVLRNKVDSLNAVLLETSSACDKHRQQLAPIDDSTYRQWLGEGAKLQEAWWKAHCDHYLATLELRAVMYEGKARDWFDYMKRASNV